MLSIVGNQIKRMIFDKGQNDKDFTVEERILKEAHDNLQSALSLFSQKAQEAFDAIISARNGRH